MSKIPKEPLRPCPSCGAGNRIANPFCKECGGRMYGGGAAPEPLEPARKVAARSAFRSFLFSLLFVAVAVILGLAFWPYSTVDVPAGTDPSGRVEHYLEMVAQSREGGRPVSSVVLSQRNVNAFLGQHADPEADRVLGALLSESRILMIANEPLGPLNLSTRLVLKPSEEKPVRFVASDLWVGHLPLPAAWAAPWTQQLAGRFGLELEPELWEELRLTGVNRNGVVVDVVRDDP